MSASSPSGPPAGTVSYHEPSIPHLLTLSSLIYLLQVARSVANAILGAGLLGGIAIGVIYGPVAKILPLEWEETILVLGYLGLVLIVFEGGLDIKPSMFVPALPLSTVAALLGILAPLAFTFALFHGFGYPTLHAFAAGSALASTSLGTTFYVLRAQSTPAAATRQVVDSQPPPDLAETRIGVTLQAAALIDDVIALAVIVSLGKSKGDTSNLGWTIGRPLVASVAMVLVIPPLGHFVAHPLFRRWLEAPVERIGRNAELLLGMIVLSGFLAIAYYAGTTMLLGAYLAGVFLYFLPSPTATVDFQRTYSTWVGPLQEHLFAPFFFASIGFSIPFLQVWRGRIVWRGIVYAILMALGKGLVGVTVVIQDTIWPPTTSLGSSKRKSEEGEEVSNDPAAGGMWSRMFGKRGEAAAEKDKPVVVAMSSWAERNRVGHVHPLTPSSTRGDSNEPKSTSLPSDVASSTQIIDSSTTTSATLARPLPRHRSNPWTTSLVHDTLPAASFLGVGLIARGEIGVLILQSAINSSSSSSSGGSRVLGEEAYLVALWAVALCTILGPVGMGWVCRTFGGRLVDGPWGAGNRDL